MYEKVMVPLDGSPLAECVLDHVKPLAAIGQINELLLLGVVEAPPDWAKEGPDFDAFQDSGIEERKTYLSKIKNDLARDGISNVSVQVLVGKPADLITESAEKEGAVLIALATHGRTGLGKWMLGSVAYKVMRYSQVPVFMVRPDSCRN
ncbi:MAG: Universal stress protein F [Syntrophaceae bacterium PtaU1.Bin231]|nr:MAG: Universal stress protein F [Syntrophaceae bacterium PtaU1.Bin231]HOG16531.1 universal stress protein [Syntrophales bacterium]